ncbi:MAG: hypothetical protein MMC33_006890 [Icmadophila ericetorum]|nr:hypothetical protein [Icmadophila ericetorum]
MDGLSLAASCIAVIQIAASVSSGLREIKGLRNASNSIFAIVNEVIDLTLVLQDVQSILESNHSLLELDQALHYQLILPPGSGGERRIRRMTWIREKDRLYQLQGQLRSTTQSLIASLATINIFRAVRIEVQVQEINSIVQKSIRRSLFVGYVGLPILSPSCDRRGCIENFEFFLNTHCVFPHWFVKRAISILLSRSIDTPPALNLRVYTVSRLNSLVSDYASRGNIDNIRILFKYRQASPFDVNRWGQTPLSCAMLKPDIEMCQFLLNEGADPFFHYGNDIRSPSDSAWNLILSNKAENGAAQALRRLFNHVHTLEDRQFAVLHNIVIGRDERDLGEYLATIGTKVIDAVDCYGRTALSWAAARADFSAVEKLLVAGADPNTTSTLAIVLFIT